MNESKPMADQATGSAPDDLPLTTRLALERTRGAYERTLMAWVRTGTSLITFGFAVYKFFQLEIAGTAPRAPLVKTTLIGPREFGLVLIGIGLLTLLLGRLEHARDLTALRKDYPSMPWSGTRLIAVLVATLGALALVGVIYRFKRSRASRVR
jgi:putative membrane protein